MKKIISLLLVLATLLCLTACGAVSGPETAAVKVRTRSHAAENPSCRG